MPDLVHCFDKMEKDVSIIIVNYNTVRMTSECIDSVLEKTKGVSCEIILVDNASSDGSRESFSADNRIKYIYSNENLGFGRANNLGLETASGRNVFFLNSDTLLRNNAVKILSNYLDANEKAGACGGNLFDRGGLPAHSFKSRTYSIWSEVDTLLHCLPKRIEGNGNDQFNYSGKPIKVSYITGADLMIPRRILKMVGGFDSDFFMYFEEAELCHRIREAGFSVVSVPSAEITHFGGASSEGKSMRENMLFQESRRLFLDKVYGTLYRKATDFLYSDKVRKLFLVKNV